MNKPPIDYPSDAKQRELEYYEYCRHWDAISIFESMDAALQIKVLEACNAYAEATK